jgi:hypothetical protein
LTSAVTAWIQFSSKSFCLPAFRVSFISCRFAISFYLTSKFLLVFMVYILLYLVLFWEFDSSTCRDKGPGQLSEIHISFNAAEALRNVFHSPKMRSWLTGHVGQKCFWSLNIYSYLIYKFMIFLFSLHVYRFAYHEIVMVLRDNMSTHAMVASSTNSVARWNWHRAFQSAWTLCRREKIFTTEIRTRAGQLVSRSYIFGRSFIKHFFRYAFLAFCAPAAFPLWLVCRNWNVTDVMIIKTERCCVLWFHPMRIFELQNISVIKSTKHYHHTQLSGISQWI